MFKKRLVAYRKMEYQIESESGSRANRMSKRQTDFLCFLASQNQMIAINVALGAPPLENHDAMTWA